jgi:hypothetical protein
MCSRNYYTILKSTREMKPPSSWRLMLCPATRDQRAHLRDFGETTLGRKHGQCCAQLGFKGSLLLA